MTIRHATIDDLDIITLIETASFHKTEAAKKEEIKDRLELNGDFFWLLDDCGEVLEQNESNAVGHVWSPRKDENGQNYMACGICGQTFDNAAVVPGA